MTAQGLYVIRNKSSEQENQGKALTLREQVSHALEDYLSELGDIPPRNLYQLVLQEIELPLLEEVLRYTNGNQSKASVILGLNRGTLRKKLKLYNLN
ncbi:MAG TPA: DNA-binding transcriptional regulator Fis [Gammaproteobacteria bacterium]|nr:DNA-binding transcriptional regulator Fis [Gammaproteobacteria bacterium]